HRRRDALPPPPPPPPPPPQPPPPPEEPEKEGDSETPEAPPPENREEREDAPAPERGEAPSENPSGETDDGQSGDDAAPRESVFRIGETFRVKSLQAAKDRQRRRGSGRRSRSRVSQKQGRYVKSGPDLGAGDLALDATLRAAAPHQLARRGDSSLAIVLKPIDVREKVREKRLGGYLFFTVDASGSMGARGRMAASKGAVMSLLLDAYRKRDRVALISFRRREATLNLPLTTSVDLAGKLLAEMPVGGRTPLSAGLSRTWTEVNNALTKNPLARPIVLIITDGRSNVALKGPGENPLREAWRLAGAMRREDRVKYVVVDTEEAGAVNFGLANELAGALGADYFRINELKAEALVGIVRNNE
ncbi:MAG: VWA domain-containing protein, partial [Candidatus Accumulibacter sp.]|nr:VWA domain-containing protein [Accumulibacter sp.]